MNTRRFWGIIGIFVLVLLALIMVPNHVGATEGCDWYLQHTPSSDHPDGWGECMWNTPTDTPTDVITDTPTIAPTTEVPPHCTDGNGDDADHNKHCQPTATDTPTSTPEVTIAPTTDTPTVTPTDASPTPVETEGTPTATPTDPTSVPPTDIQTPTPSVPAQITCQHKCVYNQSGIPGTHAVTAVSPYAQGPYYWQIKINGVWYTVYDCNGIIVTTQPESSGTTTITRLIVDGSAPTDPDSYRIIGGAGAILFDNFDY